MKVVLVSPYEIGRQPFALAEPAAWLKRDGFEVECIDLANEPFDEARLSDAKLIAIHLIMHAGARLAADMIPLIKSRLPEAAVCAYGLYAPVNDVYLRSLGCDFIFGGESEADLVALGHTLRERQNTNSFRATRTTLDKLEFITPDRSGLPALDQYSSVTLPNGDSKTVGFVESSRGCKHLCRHCPVVPVYGGVFRVISADVVINDIRQQMAAGAQHISFGDPDFLNGPTHARRIIERFQSEFPGTPWDATIKVEHLLKHEKLIELFADLNCLYITSAVESIEDHVLEKLDKGHTAKDFYQALSLLRGIGVSMLPTFVPFTPWATLEGYLKLLGEIVRLQLINSAAPVQLSIRLLLPQGSRLLACDDRDAWLGEFNSAMLGYQWTHPDPQMDRLQEQIQDWVMRADEDGLDRQEIFSGIWTLAHSVNGSAVPELVTGTQPHVPQVSEPWYCCAEPTALQKSQINSTFAPAV